MGRESTIKMEEINEKKPIVVAMGNKQKKEECIRQCISLINQERYKTLYELISKCGNGNQYIESAELKNLRKLGSPL
jgi:deoxyinosine 3'endonuclease (endonuclease V)